MTGALAASIGANPALVEVQVVGTGDQAAGIRWHRRVRLGGPPGYWWRPEGCDRDEYAGLTLRPEPPGGGDVCPACWPVWPAVR